MTPLRPCHGGVPVSLWCTLSEPVLFRFSTLPACVKGPWPLQIPLEESPMSEFRIVSVGQRHHADWDRLYAGYAEFYQVTQTPEMRDRVWSWLHDSAHGTEGLIAEAADGGAIGLAHYRAFARPLSATIGGYLDDLFVDPRMRGNRVADALIKALGEEGRRRGWSVIRWITAESNAPARSVYDRVAKLTPWRTYDIPLS